VATLYVQGRELRVYEQSRWDRARQTIVATYVYVDQRARKEERHDIVQRYLLLPDLEKLLHDAGFRVERVSGDFDNAVYTEDSDILAVEAGLRP
jgi:hypothetical protein